MKTKIITLFFALMAVMAISAQEPNVVHLADVANYIDFQALSVSDPAMTQHTVTSFDPYELANGTILRGFQKSDGSEAATYWNVKENYNTTLPTPTWEGVDSLVVGTMFRAASGTTIQLGAFYLQEESSMIVFFQPNGDSERGVEISVYGDVVEGTNLTGSGVKIDGVRPVYAGIVSLSAGSYDAGDIVIKFVNSTTNIFGVGIHGASSSFIITENCKIGDLYYNLNATDQTAEVTYELQWNANNYQSLTTANIPASVTYSGTTYSVTSIGGSAFNNCSSLTSVTIPNSVTSIGSWTFYNCSSLTSVESPALLFNDAFEIFYLSNYEMPSQYKHLTINAGTLTEEGFDRIRASYRNLESVDLTNAENTELSDEAFKGCYNLQTLRLPSVLKEIKYMAVAECVKLQAIDIPATVESIGDRAFENCRSMATVTFAGNAIQSIGCWAFYNCHALQNIVIPEGVTEIGSGAFYGCTYLNNVIVPASVSAIGDNAFALCSKMVKMQVNAVIPPTIAAKTFDEVSRQMPVYVPDLSVATYKSDPLWGQMNIIGISNIVDALDNVESSSAPVKVISDGQLFILLPDGTRYSATGVKVE